MLQKENFRLENIQRLQKNYKKDPALLERVVYAFGLLEALCLTGLPFVFKGGTCLMLLLKHPMRLSTDIDIIVQPERILKHISVKQLKSFHSSPARSR